MSGYTVKPPTGDTNEQTQFIDYFNLFYSKRGQEQISISQQLGNYGTTFFSASRQSYWNTSRSDQQISFGLNVPFGDITTSLNYSYSNNIWQNDRDHLLAFTLNVPFSHWMRTDSQSAFRNSNASYSMSNDLKGGMTNLSGVYGTLLPDNNLNYSVQVGNTHGGNTSSGTSGYSSLNYRGAYGNTNVGYSRSGDSSQIYYGMSGGIIAHADGITFGQPLGDTMVLVKAPGADNVKIENQTGIHTDWRGYAILPFATEYRENRVALNANSLADKAGKVFAFSCNVDGGSSIGAGTTSVYVNLDPVIQPGQNLVVDLSQHISCWNDYGGWYDTDHINLVQGSAFAGSLQSYKGSLYWNNVTYPFPLKTNTNVLDIGDKTPMPLPLKLYITPVGAAGGVVIKAGEVIARIHMYKIATLGSGNPRNFTWNIISNNNVVMPTGGCTVDSRNVTVDLPDFPGSAEIPLGVYCSSEQKLSFYLSGATTDSSRQVFANTAPDATKASGVGVTLMRNGKILATGENVSLGTVNKSKVPLGLSATYGQTGNKVSAGTVQSVIGVTFIYE